MNNYMPTTWEKIKQFFVNPPVWFRTVTNYPTEFAGTVVRFLTEIPRQVGYSLKKMPQELMTGEAAPAEKVHSKLFGDYERKTYAREMVDLMEKGGEQFAGIPFIGEYLKGKWTLPQALAYAAFDAVLGVSTTAALLDRLTKIMKGKIGFRIKKVLSPEQIEDIKTLLEEHTATHVKYATPFEFDRTYGQQRFEPLSDLENWDIRTKYHYEQINRLWDYAKVLKPGTPIEDAPKVVAEFLNEVDPKFAESILKNFPTETITKQIREVPAGYENLADTTIRIGDKIQIEAPKAAWTGENLTQGMETAAYRYQYARTFTLNDKFNLIKRNLVENLNLLNEILDPEKHPEFQEGLEWLKTLKKVPPGLKNVDDIGAWFKVNAPSSISQTRIFQETIDDWVTAIRSAEDILKKMYAVGRTSGSTMIEPTLPLSPSPVPSSSLKGQLAKKLTDKRNILWDLLKLGGTGYGLAKLGSEIGSFFYKDQEKTQP